jgi:hypothetical protein
LLGLLALMVGALWYDYKVARPAVEDAYNRIGKLNLDINSKGGQRFMTNVDVQNELKRAPIRTFTENGYMVEVYGWRAGVPTKHHEYYAVYHAPPPYIFLKHYMNVLDMDELRTPMFVELDPNANSNLAPGEIDLPPGALTGKEPEDAEAPADPKVLPTTNAAPNSDKPTQPTPAETPAKEEPAKSEPGKE